MNYGVYTPGLNAHVPWPDGSPNDFKCHDLYAQAKVKAGARESIVLEDGEPIAIWSRSHADH